MFHTLIALSKPAEATNYPSGENFTELTTSSFFPKITYFLVSMSQILMVLSPDPETISDPSGENAKELI